MHIVLLKCYYFDIFHCRNLYLCGWEKKIKRRIDEIELMKEEEYFFGEKLIFKKKKKSVNIIFKKNNF